MTESTLAKLQKSRKQEETVDQSSETRVVETKSFEPTGEAKPSADAIARRNRRVRSPIDGRRNVLTVKGLDPGMVGRWVINDPDRVDALMEHGYEPVRKKVQVGDLSIDQGSNVGAVVTKRVGGGKESILMQIPEEWYKADQKEKQKIVNDREKMIHGQDKAKGNYYGGVELTDIVRGKNPKVRNPETQD